MLKIYFARSGVLFVAYGLIKNIMNIRESRNTDINAIQDLHEETFGEPEGKVIAQLVGDIFKDETAKPLLSLIVEATMRLSAILYSVR